MVAHGQTPLLLLNGTNLTVVPFGAPTKPWIKANATYQTISEECNFWLDEELTKAPGLRDAGNINTRTRATSTKSASTANPSTLAISAIVRPVRKKGRKLSRNV